MAQLNIGSIVGKDFNMGRIRIFRSEDAEYTAPAIELGDERVRNLIQRNESTMPDSERKKLNPDSARGRLPKELR